MTEQGGADQGVRIVSYLIAGLLLYGGLGWIADRMIGSTLWTPVGLIFGSVLSVYMVVKRYGRE